MAVFVVLVRHGERLDEVDRREWHRIRTPQNICDPPLTKQGWLQAAKSCGEIMDLMKSWRTAGLLANAPPRMYSSPTARTLSTAAGICEAVGLSEIYPVYALNCCAAAQSYGVTCQGFPQHLPDESTLGVASVACWPPLGDPANVDARMKKRRDVFFVDAVEELADLHAPGEVVLIVSHREGIWQLKNHVGCRNFRARYCDVSSYVFDKAEKKLLRGDGLAHVNNDKPVVELQLPRTPSRRPRKAALHSCCTPFALEARSKQSAGALNDVLASGSGQVVFHREGRTGSTRLWATPGVRGQWVGRPVMDYEIVSLQCSPVQSEGNEGEFVLIKTSDGVEGWTKVKNIQIAGATRQSPS